MKEDKIMGIVIPKERTFYYLERGLLSHANSIDKLRNIMIGRGLITLTDEQRYTPYEITSLATARFQDYKIVPIYMNEHTKKALAPETAEREPTKSPWS